MWTFDSDYGGTDLSGRGNHMALTQIVHHPKEIQLQGTPQSFGRIESSPSMNPEKKLVWFASVTFLGNKDGALFCWFHEHQNIHFWRLSEKLYVMVKYEDASVTIGESFYHDELVVGHRYNLAVSLDLTSSMVTTWMDGQNKTFQLMQPYQKLDTRGAVQVGIW